VSTCVVSHAFRFLQVDTHLMLPHMWFAELFKNYRAAFMDILVGGYVDRLQEFWDDLAPWDGFPEVLKAPGVNLNRAIPLSIHGDGCAIVGSGYAWSGTSLIISIKSMVTRGPSALFDHVLCMLWESCMTKGLLLWRIVGVGRGCCGQTLRDRCDCRRLSRQHMCHMSAHVQHMCFVSAPRCEVRHSIARFRDYTLQGHTMKETWHIFSWSLYWMSKGVWPDADHNRTLLWLGFRTHSSNSHYCFTSLSIPTCLCQILQPPLNICCQLRFAIRFRNCPQEALCTRLT
jgi:hypothetical protein